MSSFRSKVAAIAAALLAGPLGVPLAAHAQTAKPYQVEWVYHVQYGHLAEWWRIFKKYQVAILDREKQLGLVIDYKIYGPGLHTSEADRWDYRIVIAYPNQAAADYANEDKVAAELFPDKAAMDREDQRRWELTVNHWDLPIREIDPHAP